MKLYHFRDEKYGLISIKQRRLKIARIMELNDPFEFLGVNLKKPFLHEVMNLTKIELSLNKGLICFSKNWSNPVQWSHYADHHRGICLEFEINDKFVQKVRYCAKRATIQGEPNFEDMRKILCTKFNHWSYEQEYRAFIELDHDDMEDGKYFMRFGDDLKLTGIIVGHSSTITRDKVSDALADLAGNVVVFKAKAALTEFKVVRNENESMWT